MAGLVLLVMPLCVESEAVTVGLPAVLSVTLKVLLPLESAAGAGGVALLSLELIATVSLVLIRFQLASTALTVTLNALPAVWAESVPVLPRALPGAAVSPGASNCSLVNAPAVRVMAELVLLAMPVCVTSDALTVGLPAVLSVTLKVLLPLTSAAFAGKTAFVSLAVMCTVSLVLTRFQLASTALTVTAKAVPAVWAARLPVFPVAVPGTAVSPGANNCSFAKAPALTGMAVLVLAVLAGLVMSLAVTVALPPVF